MIRLKAIALTLGAALLLAALSSATSLARTAPPSPAASGSPSPSPSTSPAGFRLGTSVYALYIDNAASGPGLSPPEGAGFAQGSPLSPMTPYDTFSSAPLTPGEAGAAQLDLNAQYTGTRYSASAVLGIAGVTGSMQNALYWGENLMPTLNPHAGYTALPYTIAFPTHAGQDDAAASIVSPLYASFGSADGSWLVRGGFFDVQQTLRFVFIQPPLTNVTPAIGIATPETLGNGPLSPDWEPTPEPGLPLHGVDVVVHHGLATLELSNAALPSLPGTGVTATIGSLAIDHGEGTQYAVQFAHVISGGASIATTTLYGADATTNPGPQGPLPTSTLGGQIETIGGARAGFHLSPVLDAVLEAGHTWYQAEDVFEPNTTAPGGMYHAGVSAHHGRATYGADGYRFEGGYADMILPYGTPENVWSVGWSWPGVWLKSTYQLVDNLQYPGANRQGFRVRYGLNGGPLEIRATAATFHQIVPSAMSAVHQTGFVDGFFLPQFDDSATLGEQRQYGLWVAWHPRFADVTLDYINDLMHRGFAAYHPEDNVSYQAPQAILTLSRRVGNGFIADAGFGRYAMKGSFGQSYTNVDYFQNVYFVGAGYQESAHASVLLQLRQAAFAGEASILGGPSPDFHATTLVVEQRVQ